MKRVMVFLVVCTALLLATFGTLFLVSSSTQASSNNTYRIQMLSGTFNDQNIPGDNGQTKVTLISISFSVFTKGKLSATSLINATEPLQSSTGSVLCELDVDNVSFFTDQTSMSNIQGDPESVGLTSTINGIVIGSHTFTVKCAGYTGNNGPSIPVHSMGTSVIITG